jgi:DNA topoisomerase-1
LVKSLEEHGIGRPSTYASIISVLVNRQYVTLDKRRFFPTDVGRVVAKFLINYFGKYVDYKFTANLEDDLDAISRGEKEWVPLLEKFWKPFWDLIQETEKVKRSDVTQEEMDEDCPKCGKKLSIRLGRNGRFVGCTDYPECDYTRNLDGAEPEEPEIITDRKCPECESDLLIRQGRYGKFIGCSSYPKCKFIEPLEKPKDTEVECPQCNKGNLMERKSRKGKVFFSCATYPKCSYAIWHLPLKEPCPECDWPILTLKKTKRSGTQKACPQKDCNYALSVEGTEEETESTEK